MAVSPELEQKIIKLESLNTKVANIYSEMVANSKCYMNEIFEFNAKMSVRAKREAVYAAKKCWESNEKLRIEMEKTQREARTLSDETAKMIMEEQKDFVNQLFDCEKGV